jgi:hypothetical protein
VGSRGDVVTMDRQARQATIADLEQRNDNMRYEIEQRRAQRLERGEDFNGYNVTIEQQPRFIRKTHTPCQPQQQPQPQDWREYIRSAIDCAADEAMAILVEDVSALRAEFDEKLRALNTEIEILRSVNVRKINAA